MFPIGVFISININSCNEHVVRCSSDSIRIIFEKAYIHPLFRSASLFKIYLSWKPVESEKYIDVDPHIDITDKRTNKTVAYYPFNWFKFE